MPLRWPAPAPDGLGRYRTYPPMFVGRLPGWRGSGGSRHHDGRFTAMVPAASGARWTSPGAKGCGSGVSCRAYRCQADAPTTYGAHDCRHNASNRRPQVTLYSVSIKIFRREAPPTTPDRPPGPGNRRPEGHNGRDREGTADCDKKGPGGRAGEVEPPWGGRKGGSKQGFLQHPPEGGRGGNQTLQALAMRAIPPAGPTKP